jgi:predicted O-methyltransferase YrrM
VRVRPGVLERIEMVAQKEGLPIIGPEKGSLLDEYSSRVGTGVVVEVGCLVGYSTIRIAGCLPEGGRLISIDREESFIRLARKNVEAAGLIDRVVFVMGDGKEVLKDLKGRIDMLFLDATKEEYLVYLKNAEHCLRPGSVVIADNVLVFQEQLSDYLYYVRNSGRYSSSYHEFYVKNGGFRDAVEVSVRLGQAKEKNHSK